MYAKNISTLIELMLDKGEFKLNFEDDIIDATCVTHAGEIRNQRVRDALESLKAKV